MTNSFQFKEFDLEGLQTLEAMAAAPRLNQWMYETIGKRLSGNILEIGSGIGNISECFLQDNKKIQLTDLRENYLSFLRHKFEGKKNILGIEHLDLVHPNFDEFYGNKFEKYDGLFALNVIEHIENDVQAIANCKKLLKKGGRMVILVPAYQSLYNGFDKALEHYRRYNKKTLAQLFETNHLKITHQQYFNFIGVFGWFFSGTVLQKEIIPKGQMQVFNKLVPLFKIIDKVIFNSLGLSVIVEGIKE